MGKGAAATAQEDAPSRGLLHKRNPFHSRVLGLKRTPSEQTPEPSPKEAPKSTPFVQATPPVPGSKMSVFTVTLTKPLGLTTTVDTRRPCIKAVTPGSAAEEAGLQPFDFVAAVNGVRCVGSLGDAINAIEGAAVVLTIERPPPGLRPMAATEDKIVTSKQATDDETAARITASAIDEAVANVQAVDVVETALGSAVLDVETIAFVDNVLEEAIALADAQALVESAVATAISEHEVAQQEKADYEAAAMLVAEAFGAALDAVAQEQKPSVASIAFAMAPRWNAKSKGGLWGRLRSFGPALSQILQDADIERETANDNPFRWE